MADVLEIIIIPIILFTIGFFIMRRFTQRKRWENSVEITLVTNLIWLVFSIFLTIIILNTFGNFPLFKILLVPILIPVGILILWGFYNKDLFESIEVISFIQRALLVILLFLSLLPKVLDLWLIEGNDDFGFEEN